MPTTPSTTPSTRPTTPPPAIPPTGRSTSLYYGWKIVGVAFFVDFIAVGFFFYSYGVFFKALAKEFGGSRLDVSIGITLVNIVSALIAPFLGRFLDNVPIRKVMLFGTVNLAIGFVALAFINAQWQLYVILSTLIAIGSSAMGGLSTAKLVTNWFVNKRGRALGIATMGISLSGVIMPLASALMIEAYGWRVGFFVFGIITMVLVYPLVSRFVINSPADLASRIRAADSPTPNSPAAVANMIGDDGGKNNSKNTDLEKNWRLAEVMSDRDFWLVVITFGLLFCCMGSTLTHMVPRVTDMGYSLIEAAPVLSFGAATGVIGKVAYGYITDYWSAKIAIWVAIASQFAGQVVLLYAETYWQLVIGAAIFGFGMGGIVPIHGSLVSALFGQRGFGYIMGLMRPAMLPLMVSGIPFAGWVFDSQGSYDFAFKVFLVLYVIAAIAIGFINEDRAASQAETLKSA